MTENVTSQRGLRPGMRHNGQFTEGNDARRFAQKLVNGRTLASYAREYTQEAIETLGKVMRGELPEVKPSDRLRAIDILLDRGYGKAKETVQLELSTNDLPAMSRAQLRAIAFGEPAAIEGEFTASDTAQAAEEHVS